ncbi:hypothetical protein [Candidatus Ichthyocystis hellenicum]|uniref:hypothetical protein n=1 Tax=Candidatus Ichthyocystis hellenicum TaxID=1561003 RepID=UPI000A780716|nr:hypothetical protein [Candidatus Ichthyocystis hellenicum]
MKDLAAGGVSGTIYDCSCTACFRLDRAKKFVNRSDLVHEACKRVFSDNGTDSGEYISLLRESNNKELDEIRELVNLESVGDSVVLRPSTSLSSKFMVAFAVLLVVTLVVFIVLAVLLYNGVINIPGIDTETVSDIAKWFGVGVCVVSCFYLASSLGCMMGCRDEIKAKRCDYASHKASLEKSAVIQKGVDKGLRKCTALLEPLFFDLEVATFSSSCNRSVAIEKLKREYTGIGTRYLESRLGLDAANYEMVKLRGEAKAKSRELDLLSEKGKVLSKENGELRSELGRLHSM